MAAATTVLLGHMKGENLEAMLNAWASSPRGDRLRQEEGGFDSAPDFLGDFNLELLLAPSPPPSVPAPAPVEESSGSGTASAAPPGSTHMLAATAVAAPGGGQYQWLAASHQDVPAMQHHLPIINHDQQQMQNQQHAQQQQQQQSNHQQASWQALPAISAPMQPYMLPLSAAGSGTLPKMDHHDAGQPLQPDPPHHHQQLLQLASSGSGMQHYMAAPMYTTSTTMPAGGPLVLPTLTAIPAASSQQPGSETGGDGKRRRGPRPRVFRKNTCQSDGCTVDLAPLSFYLQRNHICPDHLKADSYLVKGVPSRFCQRCGQGHPLTEFEGSKRSCRRALERHNQRRRDKQASTVTSAVPKAEADEQGVMQQQQQQLQNQEELPQLHSSNVGTAGVWVEDGSFTPPQPMLHTQPSLPLPPPPLQQQELIQRQHNGQATASLQRTSSHPLQQAQAHQPQVAPPASTPFQQQQQQQQHFHHSNVQLQPPQHQHQHQQQQQHSHHHHHHAQHRPPSLQWVMLPRQLLEQHAPHLLPAAVPSDGPPANWNAQHPVSQQQGQQQQQQQQQSQHQALIVPPQPQMVNIDEQSFSLWLGEFGGSGI